jgi:hypothetical protein
LVEAPVEAVGRVAMNPPTAPLICERCGVELDLVRDLVTEDINGIRHFDRRLCDRLAVTTGQLSPRVLDTHRPISMRTGRHPL